MGATALAVLGIIQTIIQLAPQAIQTVQDARKFIQPLWDQLTGGKQALTDAERTALYAAVDQQYADSQTPLPPAQSGDPDYKL